MSDLVGNHEDPFSRVAAHIAAGDVRKIRIVEGLFSLSLSLSLSRSLINFIKYETAFKVMNPAVMFF